MNSLKKQKLIFNKRLRKKEMKMRLVIIVLGLLWSGNAWTEKNLNFLNIKLNKKVTDFFSKSSINKYNANIPEKYGAKYKYSYLYFDDGKVNGGIEKFNDNFDIITVVYNNNNLNIEFFNGSIINLNNCIKFRNEQEKVYSDLLKRYSKKRGGKQTHADGTEEELLVYAKSGNIIKLSCLAHSPTGPYAGEVDFSIDFIGDSFNKWVINIEGTKIKD